ncbi:MAG: class I SAM-dependent methyltransferase family protein [Candidatus Thermoplasmatota archaeon]|nr:class I SAM-dependent methyltransferase family protein [Candidatus Thermoplasmatota archaeon]
MRALRVAKEAAEEARLALRECGAVDSTMRIVERDGAVMIPLLRDDFELPGIEGEIVEMPSFPLIKVQERPFHVIANSLDLPASAKEKLPRRWELIGDVLVLKLDPSLGEYDQDIAKAYARVLGAKSVLEDVGGIGGEFREPDLRLMLGSETTTVHKENGVLFKLDVMKVMFSSGNIHERIRMARICKPDETVVDMFAGIGYFSLPIAVHSKPRKVYACEINTAAFSYLEENIRLNRVHEVEPLLGDCRDVAPEGVADRVIMGYLWGKEYLGKAMRVVGEKGIIHYHEACHTDEMAERPVRILKEEAHGEGRRVENAIVRRIKSYSPNVYHVVVDAEIR